SPSARTRSPAWHACLDAPSPADAPRRRAAGSPRRSRPRAASGRRAAYRSGSRPPSAKRTPRPPSAGCTRTGPPRGRCRFLKGLADGLPADLRGAAQRDQLVGEQLQGPAATALGRFGARQADQLLLGVPLDLEFVWPWRLGSVVQRGVEALGDQ